MAPASELTVIGYWQPTRRVIGRLETGLRPALEVGQTEPETVVDLPRQDFEREEMVWGVTSAIREILDGFTDYRCQYLGIVVAGGARRVLVNCFRSPPDTEQGRFPDDGHQTWVNPFAIDDGGSDYWRIQYDVATCRFLEFDLNSSA
jgi:hypothetical protein